MADEKTPHQELQDALDELARLENLLAIARSLKTPTEEKDNEQ